MVKTKRVTTILKLGLCVMFAFLSLNTFAQVGQGNSGLTTVTGQIKNPLSGTIGIKFYHDFISRDEEVIDVPLLENNTFSISFTLNTSTPAYLIYNGNEVPIFLDPGDELYVNCKGDRSFAKTITFAGKGAGKSRYLKNVNDLFPEMNADYVFYEIVDRDPMSFRRYMDRMNNKMWGFYKSLSSSLKKDFSPAFHNYVKADIDYWYAYNLLRYRIENPISNGSYEPLDLPKNYYSFLNKILISNDKALTNNNYLFFIDQYIAFRNDQIDSGAEFENIEQSFEVTSPSMLVLKNPNVPPVIEQAEKGTSLKFLGKQSEEKSDVQIKDEFVSDYWYQIVSTIGEIGWVHGSGIKINSNNSTTQFPISEDSKNRNIYNLFTGRTLYFILANELYWSAERYEKEELRNKLKTYIDINPHEDYDRLLLYTLLDNSKITKLSESSVKIITGISITSDTNSDAIVSTTTTPSNNTITRNTVVTTKGNTTTTTPPRAQPRRSVKSKIYKPQEEFINIDPRPVDRPTSLSSLSGKITSPTGAKAKLVLNADPITMEEVMYEMDIKNGTFSLDLNLAQPTIGVLLYGKNKVNVYLEPGDLLQVKFSGTQFLTSLQFAGKGSAHNNYLKEQNLKFNKIDKEARKKGESLKEKDYLAYIDKTHLEKSQFLKQSRYAAQFSNEFKIYAEADIEYWSAYLKFNYIWEYPLANNMDAPMKMSDEYYSFLNTLPASVDGALPNSNYVYFLDQFFEHQSENPDNEGLNSDKLIDKYLVGEPNAYFKAKKFAIACKRGKASKEGKNIAAFIESNPYEIYNDVLRLVYNEAKGLQIGLDAPNFTLTDINGNELALSDLKGKVVYLDFWATWCSPCLQQMKNSKIWKSDFEGKDVVFVYVSLDKNIAAWEKYVKNNDVKGIHLSAGGDVYKSQIAKLYKVKKLPSYFLIDKQGKIAYKPERGKNITRVQDKIQALLYGGR